MSLVFQFDFYSTPHRDVTVRCGWLSLGCSCLYEYEVNESSIKQIRLVFKLDVYSTPPRDVTVIYCLLGLGRSCLYHIELVSRSI